MTVETLPGLEVVRDVLAPVRAKRADGEAASGMPTMEVRFSAFGNWYEINSFWEGEFLEQIQRGAFAKTMKESRSAIRTLFNHGFDPQIGDKVLGSIEDLREDDDAAVAVVPLFDTSYNRDLLPGLEAGVYGASMRMKVVKDMWNDEPEPSDYNPRGLPERTILEVRLFEQGPVTFPANPGSSTGIRSATDFYYERLRSQDPQRVEALARSRDTIFRTPPEQAAGDPTADRTGAASTTTDEPGQSHSGGLTPAQRRERLYPHLIKED